MTGLIYRLKSLVKRYINPFHSSTHLYQPAVRYGSVCRTLHPSAQLQTYTRGWYTLSHVPTWNIVACTKVKLACIHTEYECPNWVDWDDWKLFLIHRAVHQWRQAIFEHFWPPSPPPPPCHILACIFCHVCLYIIFILSAPDKVDNKALSRVGGGGGYSVYECR